MATQRTQAVSEASAADAPDSSGGGQAEVKASRVKEFMASITDPAEVAEFRKSIRELLEPDFKKQDAAHQRRTASEKKRADEAEALLRDSSDSEIVERLRQERGSLDKAKERAVKTGRLPAWASRNVRSFDDLWDAEDDFASKGGAKGADGGDDPALTGEDADFLARLKRLGVAVPGAKPGGATGERVTGNLGGAPAKRTISDLADGSWDPKAAADLLRALGIR